MQTAWKYLRIATLLLFAAGWIAGLAWGVSQATQYSWTLWLEHWTGDIRTALFSHRPKRQHPKIALITINDDTMQPYNYRSPIDRRLLASLITELDRAGVRAIGLDFLFLKHTEKDKDAELEAAIKQARTRIVIASGDSRVGLNKAQAAYQKKFLAETGVIGGYANLLTGGDRIVRYIAKPKDKEFPTAFADALVAKEATPPPTIDRRRIAWMLSPSNGNERFFSIPAHRLVDKNGRPTPTTAPLLRFFKDKYVIIGADFPDIDRHQVPMIKWRGEDDEIAGMLIHAQVAAQILDGRHIEHLAPRMLQALFAFLGLLGFWFGLRHGLVAVTLYATAASVLVVCADIIAFNFFARIIPFGACMAALVCGLAGGIFLRAIGIATAART